MTNIQGLRADWNTDPEYYIDFARGSIYHSQTASRGHINRIFNDQIVGGRMKHFSGFQASDLWKKSKIG